MAGSPHDVVLFLADISGYTTFVRDNAEGTYAVDARTMRDAIDSMAGRYLRLQGDGDYAAALLFIPKVMDLTPELRADLDRLAANSIPNAIRFRPAIDLRTGANGPTI